VAADFFCYTLNVSQQQSACGWYRIQVPMMHLSKEGLVQVYEDNQKGDAKEAYLAMLHSDIAQFYALTGEDVLHKFRTIKRMKPGHREGEGTGIDVYPPAIIWDCDDNTDFVHPFNQTFAHMGVRGYPDAHLLEPGEGLEFKTSEGKLLGAWVDGRTKYEGVTFDIARNLHDMKVRHEVMRTAHGVTCSSPMLAKYIREVIGCKSVYVFPNTISPEHYDTVRAVRNDKRVRVLWQGGMSHLIDWYPLREALAAVVAKYRDQFTFVIYGEYFDWINEVVPASMREFHPWDQYPAYKLRRGLMNADINLCPLANNVFNAGKSAIKFYEGSIFEDMPEATLAQRGPVFNEIVDGETGLLFSTPEEFAQKLGLLIEDADLRKRLGTAAHKWVIENRTPEKTISGLFDFYAETRAKQKRDLGKPIIQPATHEEIMKVAQPLR
jgi:glycosyltransferase involved in cell wall biosynthesis